MFSDDDNIDLLSKIALQKLQEIEPVKIDVNPNKSKYISDKKEANSRHKHKYQKRKRMCSYRNCKNPVSEGRRFLCDFHYENGEDL